MTIKDLIHILNKTNTCALPNQKITIKTHGDGIHKKIIYFGKIKDCKPFEIEGGEDWIVFSLNPDYSKQKEDEYKNIPDYNLPYIVEVI